jgi:MoaA/NifB/PqqE/SkfB family radical SAM enzyme
VEVNTTVTRHNLHDLDKLVELLKSLKMVLFRYNHRKGGDGNKLNDADRFFAAMSQVARLTYSDLTGKSDSLHHAPTGTAEPL